MSVLHEMLEAGRRKRTKGAMSINAAAKGVGVSPSLLRYRMKRYGMTLEDAVFYYEVKREEQTRTAQAVDEIMAIICEKKGATE